ncbi:RNA polymerase sigma-70 factor, ECF subfamily [Desulfomicrobium norvegicum]|uniref:RNA polymerase sigma-70 factor, ECF subfamily n=1 Tax=Desulfomicrobium norvegicum (strain DSM 1741 / NCIMB 8310) TaxID=52561 RepID=A0A8G2C3W2_DESNO|nr:sigma-70 family RNA polymerase sigma factor [Desulfomicrobium norvegicum]SFL87704.1 RNA polymerase sigma-70 factor, ECF subfamily [Desulfomicrobium norvegicum]
MDQLDNDRDDAWAVEQTLNGDREAFAVLVRRYQGPVYRLMLRFSQDESEAAEMAQDAFVRVYERLAAYDSRRRFFTWLYTLALNLARDHARRLKRAPQCRQDLDTTLADKERDPLASLEAARLLDVLRGLPPKYAETLALRYIEDMPLEEVAETLGLSISGAKMRVHRGLRMMREHFGEEEKS